MITHASTVYMWPRLGRGNRTPGPPDRDRWKSVRERTARPTIQTT